MRDPLLNEVLTVNEGPCSTLPPRLISVVPFSAGNLHSAPTVIASSNEGEGQHQDSYGGAGAISACSYVLEWIAAMTELWSVSDAPVVASDPDTSGASLSFTVSTSG
ncbi:hypothetical protein KIPB_008182 [Kipferlia bialata]|uniref:Uncharacterized protein n=1 Tax=Kipferlia bialata TaxID=797122 RepID=A0A9K3CZM1_9EUKA|nr:hypothetical protein KIPB_008182 [Kipferlia bialata]|eukprot:g8182.t1